jgi:kynureninase
VTSSAELDAADPLADLRSQFVIPDDDLIYLDGNSLGRMPIAAADMLQTVAMTEWADGLVRSWHDWIHLPAQIGARIASIIGAEPDAVALSDQTSLNLYKLASAAVTRERPDIVTDTTNFPSDIYVLRQIAEAAGGKLRLVATSDLVGPTPDALSPHVDDDVGLISVSHVAFKSGAISDLEAITELAHRHGALVLFDLSHSIGAIPIDLASVGADLAIGCTYKHCNGGPGAPAFLYVRPGLQDRLVQPIHGWWGHDSMFAFDTDYTPADDMRRFLTGTPPIISMRVAEAGITMVADVGIEAIRAKGIVLGELLEDGYQRDLVQLGYGFGSPRGAVNRGHHLSLRHPEGYRITKALIARNVVPDFRTPDNIRIGVSPLYQRPSEMIGAISALADIVREEAYLDFDPAPALIT